MKQRSTSRWQYARGISLVEVTISIVIMGTMMVTSLHLVGAARMSDLTTSRLARAQQLGQPLLTEILQKPYQDQDGAPLLGVEPDDRVGVSLLVAGTSTTTGRERFDDIDDYDNYHEEPPLTLGQLPLRSYAHWSRHVTVQWVEPLNPDNVANNETGTKRITVQMSYREALVTTLVAYRTQAWDDAQQISSDTNSNPIAVASADTNHGDGPLTVNFDGALSFDPDDHTLDYFWDFGDEQSASGQRPTHTYTRGTYNVTLTVTDALGASDRHTLTVFVRNAN